MNSKQPTKTLSLACIGNGDTMKSAIQYLMERRISNDNLSIYVEREHFFVQKDPKSQVELVTMFDSSFLPACDLILYFGPRGSHADVPVLLDKKRQGQLLLCVNHLPTKINIVEAINISFDRNKMHNAFQLSEILPSREFAPAINGILSKLNSKPVYDSTQYQLMTPKRNKYKWLVEFLTQQKAKIGKTFSNSRKRFPIKIEQKQSN